MTSAGSTTGHTGRTRGQHHRFKEGLTVPLTSGTGTQFDRDVARLTLKDLEFYVSKGQEVLAALDAAWP